MPLQDNRKSTLAISIFSFVLILLASASGAHGQQRPLITEDVDIIPPGSVRFEIGVDFMQNAKFPTSGLTGDLTRLGVVGVTIGLSPNVEIQIEGVLRNYLSINSTSPSSIQLNVAPGANSTDDTGDFTLWTKIKLRNETRASPSVGIRFGVELPNSDQARGIGLNQTNAYGMILLGKKFGDNDRVNLFGNLGIGILGVPNESFQQNDVLIYGLGGIVRITRNVNFAGEINGRANTRSGAAPLGTESLSEARLGLQVKGAGLRFDFAGIAGLADASPRSGVTFGVTYDTPTIFTPAR